MTETTQTVSPPNLHVALSPHLPGRELTTRRMMVDVLIGLSPVVLVSLFVFQWYAALQLALCVGACVATEFLLTRARGRKASIGDFSAVVTGIILALSLPGTSPIYGTILAGVVAIALGKWVFGGLGQNIFNPAMVGRAFIMMTFTFNYAAPGYVDAASTVDAITQATPLTAYKMDGVVTSPLWLLLGNTNGSLGETSAIACLLGGLYLVWRRTAAWQIPAGVLLSGIVFGYLGSFGETNALVASLLNGGDAGAILSTQWTLVHQVLGGALLFGAFFIATDPVSSPLTPKGRWIFGIGVGAMAMIIRQFSAYPEGVMFAVLLMNGVVPLINRWTIPRPLGGPVPVRK